jgi:murein L,D-transpeptidase YcbB/YkuD
MSLIRNITMGLILLHPFISCKSQKNSPSLLTKEITTIQVKGIFSAQTEHYFDSTEIPKFIKVFPLFSDINADLKKFYRSRNYTHAWFDDNGMIEQAGNLYNRIKNISDEGVDVSKLIYQETLSDLMENPVVSFKDSTLVTTELMLTAQYLQYARFVWVGIKEKESLALEWLLPRKKISYIQTLDSLLSGKDVLENPPVYKQYYLLKDYLKKYKLLEPLDTFRILTKVNQFKKGDSSLVITQIKKKLFLLGDMTIDNGSIYFDETLENAVKYFQKRMGLNQTGILKKEEIEELNIPIKKRIEQILVNMERSRWVPEDISKNYLIVNIPEFKLHAIANDSLQWSMNVVVGKSQHRTVIFNGKIQYIVFSPYWNIPFSIMKNETLPALKRNRNYLKKHNMEWDGNRIRQKPGPDNSLGLVKFVFPNSHSIYLHDTPAKSLFKETTRAFSHGCIRVGEAKKLASYLLKYDPYWDENKIDEAMNAGKERTVTLKEAVPVFIAYFTAWVGKDGSLNFRKDIYNRDKSLLNMIIK